MSKAFRLFRVVRRGGRVHKIAEASYIGISGYELTDKHGEDTSGVGMTIMLDKEQYTIIIPDGEAEGIAARLVEAAHKMQRWSTQAATEVVPCDGKS